MGVKWGLGWKVLKSTAAAPLPHLQACRQGPAGRRRDGALKALAV